MPVKPPKPKPSLAERVKTDPELLARALKDPGLRSKLPEKYLNPTQRAQRRDRVFKQDIGDISTPMSGETMTRVAEGLVDREYRPIMDSLDREDKTVDRRREAEQGWAKSYYQDIGKLFGSSLDAQRTAGQGSVAAATAARDAQLGAIDAATQQAQQRAQQDAELRGPGLDGGGLEQLAADAAQRKMRAESEGAAAEGAARTTADAQAAFLRGIQGATAQQGTEQQRNIGARADERHGELATKRDEMRAGREGKLTETLLKLRGGEVERLLTEKGISSDMEQARIDAQSKMAQIESTQDLEREKMRFQERLKLIGVSAADARAQADREFQARENELNRKNRLDVAGMNGGGAGGFSVKDRRKAAKDRDDALLMAKQFEASGQGRGAALTYLTEKYGSDFARVAVNVFFDKKPNGHLQKLLRERYGIELPRAYRR